LHGLIQTGAIPIVGAFESTYLPAHDADIIETAGYALRWREDAGAPARARASRGCGLSRPLAPRRARAGVSAPGPHRRGHAFLRDEASSRSSTSSTTRATRGGSRRLRDPRSGPAFLASPRTSPPYPWIRRYTLFNEPFATLFLSATRRSAAVPHGMEGFVGLLRNVLPPCRGEPAYRELCPAPRTCGRTPARVTRAGSQAGEAFAAYCDDRRFFAIDAMLGRAAGTGTARSWRPRCAPGRGGPARARDRPGRRRRPETTTSTTSGATASRTGVRR
jgi:hypothetical protein